MEVVNNRAHILRHIKQQADREVKKLEKQNAEELKTFKSVLDGQTKTELAQLNERWKHTRAKLKRQHESAMDLVRTQKTLEKQSDLFRKVKEALVAQLSGAELDAVVTSMVARLESSGKEIREVRVPKGSSLPNAVLDEIAVVGIISENEEIEVTIENLLHENHAVIHSIIQEELF